MKLYAVIVVFALLGLNLVSSARFFDYDGYKLIKLIPATIAQVKAITNLQEKEIDFDVLNNVKALNESVYVFLSPVAFSKYQGILNNKAIKYQIINENFKKTLEKDSTLKNKRAVNQYKTVNAQASKSIVGKFARYSEITNYIDGLVRANPSIASSYIAGTTHERRNIKTLVLKTASSNRGIFIDCGIHAREWIAVSSCIWMIDQLVNDYKNGDAVARRILNKYEIHIIPVLNPDGYEYSHTTFRMWRKNRSKTGRSNCVGVDINRNFGFKWLGGGSSTNPCSEIYAGPSADSELETKALENSILAKPGYWDAYLTIHTYGNYWLTSWSYTTEIPSDYNDLITKVNIGAAAMQPYGTTMTTGDSGVLFGVLAGVSDDWAKAVGNIKYSHTIELAPGDSDPDAYLGFNLPESKAPQVGQSFYAGVKAFINSLF